jgi:hypothetical protein
MRTLRRERPSGNSPVIAAIVMVFAAATIAGGLWVAQRDRGVNVAPEVPPAFRPVAGLVAPENAPPARPLPPAPAPRPARAAPMEPAAIEIDDVADAHARAAARMHPSGEVPARTPPWRPPAPRAAPERMPPQIVGGRETLVASICSDCAGGGSVSCRSCKPCTTCRGFGRVPCKECDANKETKCGECAGTGGIGKKRVEVIPVTGSGSRVTYTATFCERCDGDGEARCQSCSGKGDRHCISCAGKGFVGSCAGCNGTRKRTCGKCRGEGTVLQPVE